MTKYRVIAKDNLYAYPHSWKDGFDYEVVEKEGYFTLASEEGQLNYKDSIKDLVMTNFEKVNN